MIRVETGLRLPRQHGTATITSIHSIHQNRSGPSLSAHDAHRIVLSVNHFGSRGLRFRQKVIKQRTSSRTSAGSTTHARPKLTRVDTVELSYYNSTPAAYAPTCLVCWLRDHVRDIKALLAHLLLHLLQRPECGWHPCSKLDLGSCSWKRTASHSRRVASHSRSRRVPSRPPGCMNTPHCGGR